MIGKVSFRDYYQTKMGVTPQNMPQPSNSIAINHFEKKL